MAEGESEATATATLRVVVMSAVGLKDIRFLGKMKSFAVAWVDPRLKRTTKTLTTSSSTNPNWNYDELSFPLTLHTLRNPNSCVTIQILSPSSPVHSQRVIGSTALSLSDVGYEEEEIFALQLWRPSGRAQGLLKVSARIEYHHHHHHHQNQEHSYAQFDCVTGIPVASLEPVAHLHHSVFPDEFRSSSSHVNVVVPSAPPMPAEAAFEPPMQETLEAPMAEAAFEPPPMIPEKLESGNKSNDALRSVLIGFLGGAVAVATVLIGSGGGTTNNG